MGRKSVGPSSRSGHSSGVDQAGAGRDAGLRRTACRETSDPANAQERGRRVRRNSAARLDRKRSGHQEGPAARAGVSPIAVAHQAGSVVTVENFARHPHDATVARHGHPPGDRGQRRSLDAGERPEERNDRVRLLVRKPLAGGAGHVAGLPHGPGGRPSIQRAGGRNARSPARQKRCRPTGSHRPAWLSGPQGGRGFNPGARQGRPGPRRQAAVRRG